MLSDSVTYKGEFWFRSFKVRCYTATDYTPTPPSSCLIYMYALSLSLSLSLFLYLSFSPCRYFSCIVTFMHFFHFDIFSFVERIQEVRYSLYVWCELKSLLHSCLQAILSYTQEFLFHLINDSCSVVLVNKNISTFYRKIIFKKGAK